MSGLARTVTVGPFWGLCGERTRAQGARGLRAGAASPPKLAVAASDRGNLCRLAASPSGHGRGSLDRRIRRLSSRPDWRERRRSAVLASAARERQCGGAWTAERRITPAESSVAVMMTHADRRRRDRRTHDDVGGARSEGRRARGAARARLRRAGWEEPARWLAERQHGRDDAGGIRRGGYDDARELPTARSAHARRGRRRAS